MCFAWDHWGQNKFFNKSDEFLAGGYGYMQQKKSSANFQKSTFTPVFPNDQTDEAYEIILDCHKGIAFTRQVTLIIVQ